MRESIVNELATKLVAEESITPYDGQCQPILNEILESHGFTIEDYSLEHNGYTITNTFAYIEGTGGVDGPSVIFAGHTDVVEPGSNWDTNPFELTENDGKLIGRGIADMKGGIAAMTSAVTVFVASCSGFNGRIGLIFTSFEEVAQDESLDVNMLGTNHVVKKLKDSGYPVDYVIVGEPTSQELVGDTIKNGRRGIDDIKLEVFGQGGHTAYVSPKENPVMIGSVIVSELLHHPWKEPEGNFPETMLNIPRVEGATVSATVPSSVVFTGNARFSPPYMGETIVTEIMHVVDAAFSKTVEALKVADKLQYQLTQNISGEPYFTPLVSMLMKDMCVATHFVRQLDPQITTSGGTSDGRYLAQLSRGNTPAQVIEIGLVGKTVHKANENIGIKDLKWLEAIYLCFLQQQYLPY